MALIGIDSSIRMNSLDLTFHRTQLARLTHSFLPSASQKASALLELLMQP